MNQASQEIRRGVCQRLAHRIAEVCPPGTGTWPPAWSIVESPSTRFLDALADWLDADTPSTRDAIMAAADETVRAWRRAGQEYTATMWSASKPAERVG